MNGIYSHKEVMRYPRAAVLHINTAWFRVWIISYKLGSRGPEKKSLGCRVEGLGFRV